MSKPKLGSGARFRAVEKSAAASGASNPAAVAAAAGRKKYGEKKMAKLSAKGRKHGMQMGGDGYGLRHGEMDSDGDSDNSHEYK